MRCPTIRWRARLPPHHASEPSPHEWWPGRGNDIDDGACAWEKGSATAEFAIVLPSVIAIAGLLLTLGRVVSVSMDCHSAASAAARELVVSGQESSAQRAAAEVAGNGISIRAEYSERSVSVVVECPVLPGPLDVTPTRIASDATAVLQ
ncbi:TadE/TadG family type IV pilus assembly protein [Bifidobacterium callitrichidarum]|uniref:Pilus assembly protein TadE n=1 Tax=Bifidobacterium callitrichidarum TaxID=2052941 RepID=A0A2U2NAE1_9BIFI|nr:TadE family protein [Bifidobacterium callitrichidarum]PWG66040.1 pilus assembly protein TadE [Bifidobacterium callitrichidarum]